MGKNLGKWGKWKKETKLLSVSNYSNKIYLYPLYTKMHARGVKKRKKNTNYANNINILTQQKPEAKKNEKIISLIIENITYRT